MIKKPLLAAGLVVWLAMGCSPAAAQMATPTQPQHGSLKNFKWEALPNYGGQAAVIHKSPDGKRVAVANKEQGEFMYEYKFDEFLYVTSGRVDLEVIGGAKFSLKKGEVAYIVKGTRVKIKAYPGFSDITMLMSDGEPVDWK